MKIEKIVLEGETVRLEPLALRHAPGLAKAIADGELWKISVTVVPHPDDLSHFFDAAESAFINGRELAFAVIDKASDAIAGSTRFRCIECAHRRVEIGFTFLGKSWQRTHVNTEAKYLMLRHAFESWQCNRVELLTDVLNTSSRNAIVRIGAKEEGIVRSHMVMRDGRVRDSVMFSIVRSEWPVVKQALEQSLTGRKVKG
ncbi:MAG: GNAT family N-acetyltransferase [Gammaproteobacteria bacterium]|nr:GNAT family N-acetyltransferase [Gammaproteobacteria bacterium]